MESSGAILLGDNLWIYQNVATRNVAVEELDPRKGGCQLVCYVSCQSWGPPSYRKNGERTAKTIKNNRNELPAVLEHL